MKEIIWDPKIKGLHVISSGDKSAYYLFYRVKGTKKQRRSKIGDFSILTITQAREKAKEILAKVALGGDPFGDEDKMSEELSISQLFEIFWQEKHKEKNTRWSQIEIKALWKNWINPFLGKEKITYLTPAQVDEWHKRIGFPVTANRAKSVLSSMFSFAQLKGYAHQNPTTPVPSKKEKSRTRYATAEEILKIGLILEREKEKYPKDVAYIYLLMFTGARPSEIRNAQWSQLHRHLTDGLEFGILKVHGKTGPEEIVLPPQAMAVLNLLQPFSENSQKIIAKRPSEIFWKRVREEAGCPDLWLRDWRRTFGTLGLSGGMPLGMISELLNHKQPRTTMIYSKLLKEARLKAAHEIGKGIALRLQPL